MEPPVSPLLFSGLLFLGMLVLLEIGRRLAIKHMEEGSEEHVGTVEAAVFALFGLLVAFTFSGAASRFHEKQMLISEEANDIGTAYLRLDLLPEAAQPGLRDLFRKYVDSRLETYRRMPDLAAAEAEMAISQKIQEEIWTKAVLATRDQAAHPDAAKLLLPALNSMIDITTTRRMALHIHPPRIIYVLLFGLGLICSLLAGYRMATQRRSWLHIIGFSLMTVIVVYVIVDIEYPRAGLIHLQAGDQFLVDVRNSMK